MDTQMLTIVTKDGIHEQMSNQMLLQSQLINNLREFAPELGSPDAPIPIPLNNAELTTFKDFFKNRLVLNDIKHRVSMARITDKFGMLALFSHAVKKMSSLLTEPAQLENFRNNANFLTELELPETIDYLVAKKIKKINPESLSNVLDEHAHCSTQLVGHEKMPMWVAVGNKNRVFSFACDGTLRKWDLKKGTNKILYSDADNDDPSIKTFAMMSDNENVVLGYRRGLIKILNLKTKAKVDIGSHDDDIKALAISSDGKKIISGCDHGVIKIWDTKGHLDREMNTHKEKTYDGINTISLKEPYVIFGCVDKMIKIWDMETGQEAGIFQDSFGREVRKIISVPNSEKIIILSWGGLTIWDIKTREFKRIPLTEITNGVLLTLDGKKIITTPSITSKNSNKIRIWDFKTRTLLQTLITDSDVVSDVITMTPDGKQLLVGCWDHAIKVWDLEMFNQLYEERKKLDLDQLLFLMGLSPEEPLSLSSPNHRVSIFESCSPTVKELLLNKRLVIA